MAVLHPVYLNVNNMNINFLLFLVAQVCFWDNSETGFIIIDAGPFSIDATVLMQNMKENEEFDYYWKPVHGN